MSEQQQSRNAIAARFNVEPSRITEAADKYGATDRQLLDFSELKVGEEGALANYSDLIEAAEMAGGSVPRALAIIREFGVGEHTMYVLSLYETAKKRFGLKIQEADTQSRFIDPAQEIHRQQTSLEVLKARVSDLVGALTDVSDASIEKVLLNDCKTLTLDSAEALFLQLQAIPEQERTAEKMSEVVIGYFKRESDRLGQELAYLYKKQGSSERYASNTVDGAVFADFCLFFSIDERDFKPNGADLSLQKLIRSCYPRNSLDTALRGLLAAGRRTGITNVRQLIDTQRESFQGDFENMQSLDDTPIDVSNSDW